MRLRTKFQDEDFELGEVVDADIATMPDGRIKLQVVAKIGGLHTTFYDRLEDFVREWEDVPEEPKWLRDYWFIDSCGSVVKQDYDILGPTRREVGNYFESEEKAKRAVKKLKAWKQLKDKGFEFCCGIEYEGLCGNGFNIPLNAIMPPEAYTDIEVCKDLDICFGGEE